MGKMNRILHHDWLPKEARWSYLACSGLSVCKKDFTESHIMNPLLTKLVYLRWLDIGSFFASLQTLTWSKKELGQYLAIVTSHLVNNPYLLHDSGSQRANN